jgi:hypothetical protein
MDTIGLVKVEIWRSFLPDEEKVRIYNSIKENGCDLLEVAKT